MVCDVLSMRYKVHRIKNIILLYILCKCSVIIYMIYMNIIYMQCCTVYKHWKGSWRFYVVEDRGACVREGGRMGGRK